MEAHEVGGEANDRAVIYNWSFLGSAARMGGFILPFFKRSKAKRAKDKRRMETHVRRLFL